MWETETKCNIDELVQKRVGLLHHANMQKNSPRTNNTSISLLVWNPQGLEYHPTKYFKQKSLDPIVHDASLQDIKLLPSRFSSSVIPLSNQSIQGSAL